MLFNKVFHVENFKASLVSHFGFALFTAGGLEGKLQEEKNCSSCSIFRENDKENFSLRNVTT
jgi:hypothetical protein